MRCPHEPDHKAFARLNMEFFAEISAMTGNQPLREISERLYFQTSRIVLKLMPRLNLAEEFAAFRREMEDVLAAMEIGDLESVGHIRRSHISMSFKRMMRYARRAVGDGKDRASRRRDEAKPDRSDRRLRAGRRAARISAPALEPRRIRPGAI